MVYFLGENSKTYIWFMYCFPIFRLLDFFSGCCLAKYYLKTNGKRNFKHGNIVEIIALALTILILTWRDIQSDYVWLTALKNWTSMYIVLAVMWVYLFLERKGLFTKIMTNKWMIFLGNISAYTYLIHYVIILYVNKFILPFMEPNLILTFIEFIITVFMTLIYFKIFNIKKPKLVKYY